MHACGERRIRDSVPRLMEILDKDPSSHCRAVAAVSLGMVGGDQACEGLLKATEDKDEGIAGNACFGLAMGRCTGAIPRLIEILHDKGREVSVRGKAAYALGVLEWLKGESPTRGESIAVLHASLEDEIEVAGSASIALANLEARDSIPAIAKRLLLLTEGKDKLPIRAIPLVRALAGLYGEPIPLVSFEGSLSLSEHQALVESRREAASRWMRRNRQMIEEAANRRGGENLHPH